MPKHPLLTLIFASVFCIFKTTAALAAPDIYSARLTIDKPDYSSSYPVGLSAYVRGPNPVVSVEATHLPYSSGSAGTWNLENLDGNRWWNWASNDTGMRVYYADGNIDGYLSVTATDDMGLVTSRSDIIIPDDVELDFVSMSIVQVVGGFYVTGDVVDNAENYWLWVWDPIDRYYPYSKKSIDPSAFPVVPESDLIVGRTYRIFLHAVKHFSIGQLDPSGLSIFRSYAGQSVLFRQSVPIDLLPSAKTNKKNNLNVRRKRHFEVAILSTSIAAGDSSDFDATQVDPSTVRFGPGKALAIAGSINTQDADRDGDIDMVLSFDIGDAAFGCADYEAILIGQTWALNPITGIDSISIKGCK